MYLLGCGTYGSVYRTVERDAIKKSDPYYSWIALREMITMRYLSLHDNHSMIDLHEVNYNDLTIRMELAEIDLKDWNNIKPSVSRRCLIIREVIKAIYLLHQIGIVHGDLKTANLVLTSTNQIKLIDFGFSGPPNWAFTQYTTPVYKDKYETNGFNSDIYSLGIIMIELFTGIEFDTPPNEYKIKETTHLISKDYRYLIRSMVGRPSKRPNITQIMNHFGIEPIVLPSLKMINLKHGQLYDYERRWINHILSICNVTGPNKVSDFFSLLSLFTNMADYRSDLQFYGLAIIYIYSAYFQNPINYPTLISMAPSFYSRINRKTKLNHKINFLINNEHFVINLFSLIN